MLGPSVPGDQSPGEEQMLRGDPLVIRDLATLKIISDPLRRRMLEIVREDARTAKELAAALHVSQTRLYYHLNLLEQHSLIRVAETRLVSGIIEKRYRATAYRLTIDKALIGPTAEGNDALDAYVSVVLDQVQSEINRSVDAGLIDLERTRDDEFLPRALVLGRKWLRLTPAQLREFSRRYEALLDDLEEFTTSTTDEREGATDFEPEGQTESQSYEWLIAFYPTASSGAAEPPNTESSMSFPRGGGLNQR